ncbi:hypothetical protein CcrC1_gp368 [Caulobacter phage C1]|nr:hypothetical protein CcrC1_gp368 [Caulobacter phage C1]UTU08597.1 hypothetical protein CcrC2_gp369 [Caulobacter phage C2]UTU09112.1 hypothetical protein CcrJ4_gp363 [Caulobacter phage J4]UTU09671.1 hypothetical protein CcrBL47_gp386 [Caulobacter phage BL47]UTU10230.1 tape measure protein [Caulobacter phage RB23]WGN97264.1 hypothetical protein [Bertelyvirus sp.]
MTYVRQIEVKTIVRVEVDETKFTPEFMEEYSKYFNFRDTVEEHQEYLGRIFAAGIIDGFQEEFVEGYGKLKDMGIRLSLLQETAEVLHEQDEVYDDRRD